jgi:hypothetical protein
MQDLRHALSALLVLLVGLDQRVDCSALDRFMFDVAARHGASGARPAQCIEFVDEHDARAFFLGLGEQVAHPRRAHPDEHFHEFEAADRKKGTPASSARALASKIFPVPGAPTMSTPLGILAPSFW